MYGTLLTKLRVTLAEFEAATAAKKRERQELVSATT